MNLKLCCPTIFGIEGILSGEMKRLGFDNIKADNGKVYFEGDFETVARANLNLRTAERVLIVLASFKAESFEELFQGVKSIAWEDYIGKNDQFPVKGWSLNSKLASVPDCQSIVKKAVVERLKSRYNISWFEESGALYKIQFSIYKDMVDIMLDTSGDGLHKRGYRAVSNLSPLRETLAAAIVDIARVREFSTVYDPFCGSGTILIEAAQKALNIAPGINRKFLSESWGLIDSKIWQRERERCRSSERKDIEFVAFGSDIDINAVNIARDNLKKAGVAEYVRIEQADFRDFSPKTPKGTVICNPPYGERMLTLEQAEELYRLMGEKFLTGDGFSYYILSSNDRFEELFSAPADKRRKLYNGMIKCQLYMYYK